jgi:anti-sigma B factor antagonist
MSFDVKLSGRILQVRLQDSIDLSVTAALKENFEQLMSSDVHEVQIDAGALTYIDSSGVASLLFLRKLATRFNAKFVMLAVSDAAARVIQLANLDALLGVKAPSSSAYVSPTVVADGLKNTTPTHLTFSDADALDLFNDPPKPN